MILIGLQRFPPQKTFAIKHRSFESETENRLSRREMLSVIGDPTNLARGS